MKEDSRLPKSMMPATNEAKARDMTVVRWSRAQPMAMRYLSAAVSNQSLKISSQRAIPLRLPWRWIEGSCQREESIGSRVNETNRDTSTAKATLMPNWKKKRPTIPFMKATGTKTAMMEMVVAKTASPISEVPNRDSSIWSW